MDKGNEITISVPRSFEELDDGWGYVRQEVCRILYDDNWNSLSCEDKELPSFPICKYSKLENTNVKIMFDRRVDHRKQTRLYQMLCKAWKEIPGFTYEIKHSFE